MLKNDLRSKIYYKKLNTQKVVKCHFLQSNIELKESNGINHTAESICRDNN